ncbi:MAG: alpha/beta hydrolase, partial [Candidatus Dormibacteraeota bacterium]|nr:alpha/beta hydrolase [Candidatus Dormibacteraeota bacterium]
SVLFAREHPERARALILYGSWARRVAGPGYPWGLQPAELDALLDQMGAAWATGEWWAGPPVSLDDDRHRRWWARYLRMSASPSMARDLLRMNAGIDNRDVLPALRLPVLVLHRAADTWVDIGHARFLAANLPCVRYVELPDTDHRLWLGDTAKILDEVQRFLLGPALRSRRRVTAARIVRSRAAAS